MFGPRVGLGGVDVGRRVVRAVGKKAVVRRDGLDIAEQGDNVFAQMLELPDQDVLSWVTQQATLPKSFDSALMRALLNFRPVNHHD